MRESVAKRLRKEAKFEKNHNVEITGDRNITVGCGQSTAVINVKVSKLADTNKEYEESKTKYNELKAEYYNNK